MVKKTLEFIETWGRLIGAFAMIVYQAIANAQVINPESRLDIFPTSEKARLIVWVFIFILMTFEIYKWWKKAYLLENPKPILKIYQKPDYSLRRLPDKNRLVQGNDPIVSTIQFFNQPDRFSNNALAKEVAVQFICYDINQNPLFEPIYGMWAPNDETPDTINLKAGLKQLDFKPNGLPHQLFLLLKYRDDPECYALTNESFEYQELKYPHIEINRKRFFICVRLIPTNSDAVEFYFMVKNHGKDGGFEIIEHNQENHAKKAIKPSQKR